MIINSVWNNNSDFIIKIVLHDIYPEKYKKHFKYRF